MCFKSALRVHYIPLCLLENHYGAIKSNVVSHTNMGFSSVSDGCALPLCLLWICTLVTVKRYSCRENTQQMAVARWCFLLFLYALWHSPERGTSVNDGVQLTPWKQCGSGMFSDKIHLTRKMKRNWNFLKKWNVQCNSKMYCSWKLFNYSS